MKANIPDAISFVILKIYASELAPSLVKLFHLCLSALTSSCWKREPIQHVLKEGPPSQPSNDRPTPITSVLSKVFESIFNWKTRKPFYSSSRISDL